MTIIKNITYCALIMLVFLRLAIPSESNQAFNLTEVAKNNYVHIGSHVSIEDVGNDDIANIGFIVGNNCVAVIDTGGSIKTGKKLKNSIRKITKKPICYVINTHEHFDHILGNKAFLDENPNFVGHKDLAEAINRNRDFFLTQFKNNLGPGAKASDIIEPNILIEESTRLELGGHTLTLIPSSLPPLLICLYPNQTNTPITANTAICPTNHIGSLLPPNTITVLII